MGSVTSNFAKWRVPALGLGALFCLALAILPQSAAASGDGDDDWIQTSGDFLQIALPVIGGAATFFTNPDPDRTWDREGTRQFVYAYASAWSTTYLLKFVMAKARPNGNNRTSFPSGHTMSAFAGAGFIDGRFGKTFGLPALALATFTGYSRVHSQWHYRDDVLAGASIGLISNWYFTEPLPGKWQLLPTVGAEGYGVKVTIGNLGGPADPAAEARPRGANYRFTFGPAFLISNVTQSMGDGGTPFELGDLNRNNDPTTTATVSIGIPVSSRGRIELDYGPFEARDEGVFNHDVSFGGQTYAAGDEVHTSWRYYDARAKYLHTLHDGDGWSVFGGAGIGLMYSYVAMQTPDESTSSLVDDQVFYPYLHLTVNRKISSRITVGMYSQGVTLAGNWVSDAGANLTWHPARAWDMNVGYTWFTRHIESDTFFNETRYNLPHLSVVRYW